MKPTRFQNRVLSIPEEFNLAILGGRGGGKTTAAEFLILRHTAQHEAKSKTLVVRQSYKSLADMEDNLESMFVTAYGSKAIIRNRAEHTMRLANGATVEFSPLDAQTYPKFQGREFSLLVSDETGNFTTLKWLDMVRSNMRVPDVTPRIVVLANPGGPMHSVLAKRHVNGRIPWRPYEADDGERWVTCPSVYTDNPHLNHERYQRQIIASAGNDRALAQAWLSNSWDAVSGAFFGDCYGPHLIIPDDEWRVPREGWRSFIAMDWGMSAPSVALFIAQPRFPGLTGPAGRVFPEGIYIVIDEIATAQDDDPNAGLGWPPSMLAEEILIRCQRWNVRPHGVGDDARGLEGSTLLEQFREHGVYLEKPRKDRISGWVRLKSLMAAAKNDDPDAPGLWIRERCRYLHETMPTLPRSKLRPEDVDTRAADHGADALRYGVTSQPGEWSSSWTAFV